MCARVGTFSSSLSLLSTERYFIIRIGIHSRLGVHLECLQLLAFANISASVNILHTSPVHTYEGLSRIYTRHGIAGLKEYTFSNLAHFAKDSQI